jgi:hypothetical protein
MRSALAISHSKGRKRPGITVLAGVLAAGVSAFLLVGCGYGSIRSAQQAMREGQVRWARGSLASDAEGGFAGPHAILGWLEYGTALHESGAYDQSSGALLRAEAGFDAQDRRPRTSLTEELFATATSPLNAAYRGTPTDRVMAPTLRAMNAMLSGDDDAARLALNEAAIRQAQSLERRREEIAAARARDGSIDVDRSVQAALADPALDDRLGGLRAFEPYRGFVNPFSEMLHAVYRLAAPRDPADRERGLALLRSVVGTVDNRFVGDLLASETTAAGAAEARVHVFFASGFCPIRDEFRLDLPLFLFNDTIDYVGVSFPRLAFDDDALPHLDVETPDGIVRTEMLADMDRLMATEFREELPTLLTRAVLSTVAKVAASYGLNEATRDDETANAIARIVAGLYLYSQNRADTRAWATLPKWYAYTSVPAPADGRVLLSAPDGSSAFVDVSPGAASILFVRSFRPGRGLVIRSVQLAREAGAAPGTGRSEGGKNPAAEDVVRRGEDTTGSVGD